MSAATHIEAGVGTLCGKAGVRAKRGLPSNCAECARAAIPTQYSEGFPNSRAARRRRWLAKVGRREGRASFAAFEARS